MSGPSSRRRFLTGAAAYAAGAAVVTGAAALASEAKGATVDRAAWDKAFAVMTKAKREYDAFMPQYDRMWEACQAARPDEKAVDLSGLPTVFVPNARTRYLWSNSLDQLEADLAAQEGKTWFGEVFKERHRQAFENIRRFRAQDDAVKARFNLDHLNDECERVEDAERAASWALFAIPAPDLAALAWKSEHLFAECVASNRCSDSYAAAELTVYLADVRRLAAMEA